MGKWVFSQELSNFGVVPPSILLVGFLDVSNLPMALRDGDHSDGSEVNLTPLCTLPPSPTSSSIVSDWVLKKIEETQAYVGISCDGYE